MALQATLMEGDSLYDELEELRQEVESELRRGPDADQSFSQFPSASLEAQPIPHTHEHVHSSTATIVEMEKVGLHPSDKEWIISIVDIVITPMQSNGRKNLLRASLPEKLINYIDFDKSTRSTAEAMIDMLLHRDKLTAREHPHISWES